MRAGPIPKFPTVSTRPLPPSAAGIFLSRTFEDKANLLRLIPNGRMVSHKMSRAGVQLAADSSDYMTGAQILHDYPLCQHQIIWGSSIMGS